MTTQNPLQTSQALGYYLIILNDFLVTHGENAIGLVTYTVFLKFDSVFLNRLTKKKQVVKLRQDCDFPFIFLIQRKIKDCRGPLSGSKSAGTKSDLVRSQET